MVTLDEDPSLRGVTVGKMGAICEGTSNRAACPPLSRRSPCSFLGSHPRAQTGDQAEAWVSKASFSVASVIFWNLLYFYSSLLFFKSTSDKFNAQIRKRSADHPFSFLLSISCWSRCSRQQRIGKKLKQKNTIVQLLTEWQSNSRACLQPTPSAPHQCHGWHPTPAQATPRLLLPAAGTGLSWAGGNKFILKRIKLLLL